VLNSSFKNLAGSTYVDLLKPQLKECEIKLYSGDSTAFVFGDLYGVKSPWPEARGTRIMVSPKNESNQVSYAAVFQMTEQGSSKLPVYYEEKADYYLMRVADRLLVVAKPNRYLNEPIEFVVPGDQQYEVVVVGLKDGFWNMKSSLKNGSFNINVLKGNHTTSWKSKAATIYLSPGRQYGAQEGKIN